MLKPEDQLREDWIPVFNKVIGLSHHRVENKIGSGTPDYAFTTENGTNGWIEFKCTKAPKLMLLRSVLPSIKGWKGLQRNFMRDRAKSKSCFLLLRVGDTDYLMGTGDMFSIEVIPLHLFTESTPWAVPVDEIETMSYRNIANLELFLSGKYTRYDKEI